MRTKDRSSLHYLLVTMKQIQVVLRDFDLDETAAMLDPVIIDLDRRIPAGQAAHRERR